MPPKGGSKKAAAPAEDSSAPVKFSIGDKVLGRIKGYPPWPAKIVDPEQEYLTKAVLAARPSKKQVFLLRFYTDGNYSWSTASEMKPLSEKAIEAHVASAKGGALMNAYKTAQDPDQWEADNAQNQDKLRQKDESKDQLDDSEDEAESGKTGNKRKRKADAKSKDAGEGKKAKTEPKKKDAKSKAGDKKAAKPAEDVPQGEAQCKDWRNKLQKGFLTKGVPSASEAPVYDQIFTDMEAFEHKQEWLAPTKLPKVIKKIAALKETIPGDDKYHFKDRASSLLDKWKDSLLGGKEDADEAAPTANGTSTEEKTESAAEQKPTEEAAPAPETNGENKAEAVPMDEDKKEEETPAVTSTNTEEPAAAEPATEEKPAETAA